MDLRWAAPRDELDVRRILDAAVLEAGDLEERIGANDVLVAVDDGGDERLLGTLVLAPSGREKRIAAIAVRRPLRDRGIGSELVEGALEREGHLVAHFDDRVRPFYEALGFSIEAIDESRLRGVRTIE